MVAWTAPLAAALGVVASICSAYRFYVRARVAHTFDVSDWLLLSSLAFYVLLCTISCLPPATEQLSIVDRLAFACYTLSTTLVKFSIAIWLPHAHLWPQSQTMFYLCVQAVSTILVNAVLCLHGASIDPSSRALHAETSSQAALAWTIANAVTTGMIPVAGFWVLVHDRTCHMRTKLACGAVSLLGVGSFVAATARVLVPLQITAGLDTVLLLPADETDAAHFGAIAALLEVGLAITCSCFLAVRPHLARWLPDKRQRLQSSMSDTDSEKASAFIPEIVVTPPPLEARRPTTLRDTPRNDHARHRDWNARPTLTRQQAAVHPYRPASRHAGGGAHSATCNTTRQHNEHSLHVDPLSNTTAERRW